MNRRHRDPRTAQDFRRTADRSRLAGSLLLVAGLVAAQASADSIQERLGHPPDARLLMIHADDLGMSQAVNRASLEALEKGWVTSASLMVPCPWFPEIARWAREHPDADLGLHLTLNSEWDDLRWGPVSPVDEVASLLDEDGYLPKLTSILAAQGRPAEAERELRAQIARAKAAGIHPTHFDNHMRALMETPALLEVYRRLGRDNGVPVMLARATELPEGASVPEAEIAVDDVLGIPTGLTAEQWSAAYRELLHPLGPGVYILIVHLATDDAEMRAATRGHVDWGAAWRQSDYDLVRDPGFRSFLHDEGFVLIGWRDLARALASE